MAQTLLRLRRKMSPPPMWSDGKKFTAFSDRPRSCCIKLMEFVTLAFLYVRQIENATRPAKPRSDGVKVAGVVDPMRLRDGLNADWTTSGVLAGLLASLTFSAFFAPHDKVDTDTIEGQAYGVCFLFAAGSYLIAVVMAACLSLTLNSLPAGVIPGWTFRFRWVLGLPTLMTVNGTTFLFIGTIINTYIIHRAIFYFIAVITVIVTLATGFAALVVFFGSHFGPLVPSATARLVEAFHVGVGTGGGEDDDKEDRLLISPRATGDAAAAAAPGSVGSPPPAHTNPMLASAGVAIVALAAPPR